MQRRGTPKDGVSACFAQRDRRFFFTNWLSRQLRWPFDYWFCSLRGIHRGLENRSSHAVEACFCICHIYAIQLSQIVAFFFFRDRLEMSHTRRKITRLDFVVVFTPVQAMELTAHSITSYTNTKNCFCARTGEVRGATWSSYTWCFVRD